MSSSSALSGVAKDAESACLPNLPPKRSNSTLLLFNNASRGSLTDAGNPSSKSTSCLQEAVSRDELKRGLKSKRGSQQLSSEYAERPLFAKSRHAIGDLLSQQLPSLTRGLRTIEDKEEKLGGPLDSPLSKLISQWASAADYDRPMALSGIDKALQEALSESNISKYDSSHLQEVKKMVDQRQKTLNQWSQLRAQITKAQDLAAREEKQKAQQVIQNFKLNESNAQALTTVRALLKLDNEELLLHDLLQNPEPSPEEKGEEQDPHQQKHNRIQALLKRIKKYNFSSVDSRVKKVWFVDPTRKMIELELPGVLETDASKTQSQQGSLEAYKHRQVSTQVHYDPEALKILERMNWRISYLKNPRFKLPPIEFENLLSAENSAAAEAGEGKHISSTSTARNSNLSNTFLNSSI